VEFFPPAVSLHTQLLPLPDLIEGGIRIYTTGFPRFFSRLEWLIGHETCVVRRPTRKALSRDDLPLPSSSVTHETDSGLECPTPPPSKL